MEIVNKKQENILKVKKNLNQNVICGETYYITVCHLLGEKKSCM